MSNEHTGADDSVVAQIEARLTDETARPGDVNASGGGRGHE